MRKNLLIILVTLFAGAQTGVIAQCVPDLSITVPGIYPDSATGLPNGTVGIQYSEDIQARVLTDTTFNGLPVVISNITMTSVTGLPPGLTYACTPASCIYPGGSNGCILISGTPTTAGVYPITVTLTANGTIFGVPAPPQTTTLDYYSITIDVNTGIAGNLSDVKFNFLHSNPNPATNYTDVTFTTPVSGDFVLKMYNMIGKEVLVKNIRAAAGTNTNRVNLDKISAGVYMMSIENGTSILTRRVIVSGK